MTHSKFMINPFKCFAAVTSSLLFLSLAFSMISTRRWFSICIFLLLSLIFGYISLTAGCILHLDDSGLYKTLFGLKLQYFAWTDIAEVGIAGTKVFHQKNSNHTGSIYLYFSPKSLSKDERFDLMLRWPPSKNTPYMIFNKKRFTAVQLYGVKKSRNLILVMLCFNHNTMQPELRRKIFCIIPAILFYCKFTSYQRFW